MLPPAFQLHASAFAYDGAGCLLLGASGSGKSTLLAEALLRGAQLIADDQVLLHAEHDALIAQPPATIAGLLELRGLGLIQQPHVLQHAVHLVVHLAGEGGGGQRLPEPTTQAYCGIALPMIALQKQSTPSVAGLLLFLKAVHEKRNLPTDWFPVR